MAVFKDKSDLSAEKIKKEFQNNFQENNLKIVIKCNLKTVDYLDVTLNLLNNNTNLSLNLTTKSTLSIRNPTIHRL